jgi:outer membrane protein assembly factor BamB
MPAVTTAKCAFTLALILITLPAAADWPSWRGPNQNGTSNATGLIDHWSPDGENLIWKADFIGRSTPVLLNGRVYVIGRGGKDITEQERVACFNAKTGEKIWEHRFNVFHTTIPFNRVGWASLVGDPNTGHIYAHGVQGMFFCFNKDGKILWSKSLTEEYGRISGYGGRTHTPVVDENLVIISYLNNSWGDQGPTRHRYYALDKRDGTVVWVSTGTGPPLDTTYSVPVIAVINGQRLLIGGNAHGAVIALKVRTGELVWKFTLSKRGINSSVVVDGSRVYAMHSEENIDNTSLGRVVCIDATGQGDVTKTHEQWRYDGIFSGYTSPTIKDGVLYVVDNSANVHAVDADTGMLLWDHSVGTVGKGSPVWADGKLYATSVNGGFSIISASRDGAVEQSAMRIEMSENGKTRHAEIYGSPAVAYGRIYFTTEEGVYCLGAKDAPFNANKASAPALPENAPDKNATPTHIQIIPAEITLQPGDKVEYTLRAFDSQGRFLRKIKKAEWGLNGIHGKVKKRTLEVDKKTGSQIGTVVAHIGELEATAKVRVIPPLNWEEDFSAYPNPAGQAFPPHWIGAANKFKAVEHNGEKVLLKHLAKRGLQRSNVYIGPYEMSDYTIQIDLLGTKNKRRKPDMGLVAQRYTLDMQGNHQRLQIRSWASDLRMAKTIDFDWQTDVWYTIKMKVETTEEKATIYGKVWKRGEAEPDQWTITAEDPLPNRMGSPGIYGYSATEIYYDNLKVW